jgi:hypothetical protein
MSARQTYEANVAVDAFKVNRRVLDVGLKPGSGESSQHGEHAVIDAVFREIGVKSRTCVEFGAYDLSRLSNVYPLWTSGWKTLLIEGDPELFAKLEADYMAHPLRAEANMQLANRFVGSDGPDSLDRILEEYGFPTDPDLVSIDVDGLELQIWRGLRRFRPRLLVVEYNPTIPTHIEIVGANNVGSSALALARLGHEKGYSLVACVGWNAFFVEEEHASRFADADDLDALFDPSYLRYAMQTYGGELFYSAPPVLWVQLYGKDTEEIESSSVEIGRMHWTPLVVARRTVRYFLLRPLKRGYFRIRGRFFRLRRRLLVGQ